MSEIPTQPDVPPQAPQKKGGVLRVILIVIMLVLFGLLGWDLYARWVVAAAFDKVVAWVEEGRQNLDQYEPADVQKLLGRQPDNGLEDKQDYALETYSWPRGMLVKSYYITVIYRKADGKALLHEVVKNTPPEANDLPNPPADATPPADNELELAPRSDEPAATTSAGGHATE